MTQPSEPTGPVRPEHDPNDAEDANDANDANDHVTTPPPPPPPPPPAYGAAAPPAHQPGYEQPAYGQGGYAPGIDPAAPYGVHPVTGVPYSDKSKLVAGLLQILIPLGIGRMYLGDTRTGVIQLIVTLVTCGIGALWPFIDGIMILVGDPVDSHGRPLRS